MKLFLDMMDHPSLWSDPQTGNVTGDLNLGNTVHSVALAGMVFFAILVSLSTTALGSSPKALIRNEIPYGERKGALLAQGAEITGLLCIESRSREELHVELIVRVPPPLKPTAEDSRLHVSRDGEDGIVETAFPLHVEGEKWFNSLGLSIPEDAPPGEYVIQTIARVHGRDGVETIEHTAHLRVVSREDIPTLFEVGALLLPCNEKGEPEDRHERSTVLVKGRKTFWQGMVEDRKQSSRFDTRPDAYVRAPIRNQSPHKAIMLVRMDVLDPLTGERIPGFELPYAAEHGDTLGEVSVYEVVEMEPESQNMVVLPFYVNAETVRPGMVTARIRAILFGTNIEAGRSELSVKVVGVRWMPAMMTAAALLTTLGGLAYSYRHRNRFFRMKGNELILIALFGTVIFAVVSIPGTLLFNVAHIILGPLSFLVTGFFHEILFYLLLVSLVVLIPRVGAVSLVIGVRFLMNSFVLGELSPISVLYYATTAACLELAVFVAGLTRGRSESDPAPGRSGTSFPRRRESRDRHGPRQVLVTAVVLGLTDAYLSFVFFNLSMFFYRLHYANWYLGAYLLIDSFLFTLIAVPFGFKLGNRLKVTAHA